jgi:hypothetical protein
MPKYDVTKTNLAIERLLEVTENPRHRFLLQSYYCHRYLEIAGRYEEIFAPQNDESKHYISHAGRCHERNIKRTGTGEKPLSDVGREQRVHLLRGK